MKAILSAFHDDRSALADFSSKTETLAGAKENIQEAVDAPKNKLSW